MLMYEDQFVKTHACKIDYYINYIELLDFLLMINIWLLSS